MILQLDDFLQETFATVFFIKENNLVFKVFKSYRHPDNADKSSQYSEQPFNEWMQNIYGSETTAYELAAHSSIGQYFLKLHSGYIIDKITDKQGNDVSEHYLLDCTYVVDYLPGPHFDQYSPIVRTYCLQQGVEIDKIFQHLKSIGINHFKETVVVFVRHSPSKIVIVNIATCAPGELQPPSMKDATIKDKIRSGQ